MDVQWLIIARACSRDSEGCLDIEGIFQRLTFDVPPYRASFVLIAKIQASPLEVGEEKAITVRIRDDIVGVIGSFEVPYRVPDLATWAASVPVIVIPLSDIEFPRPGEYSFDVVIDGEVKAGESITILVEPPREKVND